MSEWGQPVEAMNPMAFGAKGIGTGDDTVAITKAITEAGQGTTVLPRGTFVVSDELVLSQTGARLIGAGNHSSGTVITTNTTGLERLLRISGNRTHVQGIYFDGNAKAKANVLVHNAGRGSVDHIYCTNATEWGVLIDTNPLVGGLSAGNNNSMAFYKVICTSNTGVGFGMRAKQSNNQAIDIFSLTSTFSGSHGALIKGNGIKLWGGHMESNTGYGIQVGETADGATSQAINIKLPHLEGNTAGGVLFQKATKCHYEKLATSGVQDVDWVNSQANSIATFVDSNNRFYIRAGAEPGEIQVGIQTIELTLGTAADRDLQLIPKGAGGVKLGGGSGFPGWYQGSGSPEGVVTAVRGSFFSRLDGGAATCFYVKESGVGTTGWVAK